MRRREGATLHPAADRETTCTAATTVPRDRESLKATGADQTGISISVPGSCCLPSPLRWASHRRYQPLSSRCALVCVSVRVCVCAEQRKRGEWHFFRAVKGGQQQSLGNNCKIKKREGRKTSSLRLATGAHRRRGAGPAGSSIRTLRFFFFPRLFFFLALRM